MKIFELWQTNNELNKKLIKVKKGESNNNKKKTKSRMSGTNIASFPCLINPQTIGSWTWIRSLRRRHHVHTAQSWKTLENFKDSAPKIAQKGENKGENLKESLRLRIESHEWIGWPFWAKFPAKLMGCAGETTTHEGLVGTEQKVLLQ